VLGGPKYVLVEDVEKVVEDEGGKKIEGKSEGSKDMNVEVSQRMKVVM